ncbi:uncharacterized protein [Antedon mediterranea]|uniref:uncharacterized protein n=1 Tax=Antedon mediterranea TaxID=105859 RepID=UPI003AF8EF00
MSALHWEALRKQKVIDRKHHQDLQEARQHQKREAEEKLLYERIQNESSTYKREVASTNGDYQHHCHHDQDAERRLYFKDRCKTDYNAKMSTRYNDINFAQQW